MLKCNSGELSSCVKIEDYGMGLWSWDMRSQTVEWSSEQRTIFGISAQEVPISLQLFCRLVHPDDRARVMAKVSDTLGFGPNGYSHCFRIVRPDGSIRHVRSQARLDRDRLGRPVRLHGIDIDITDPDAGENAEACTASLLEDIAFHPQNRFITKALELAFRAGDEDSSLLRVALTAGRMAVWQMDLERQVVTVDETISHLFGIPGLPRDIPVNLIDTMIEPDDLQGVIDARAAAMRGEFVEAEFRVRDPEGSQRWLRSLGEAKPDSDGVFRQMVGVLYDITTRKDVEARLRESEDRFRTVTEAMPQMVWSTKPDGYHDFFNKQWTDYVGRPQEASFGEGWRRFFHVEDHPEIEQRWSHAVSTGEPYEIEYRLRHHSGSYRWVLGRAVPIRDEKGQITRWLGTCTDIHDMKLAMERQQLLLDEMDHRVKNILSLVQAIARQTFGSIPDAETAQESFSGRIQALVGAYSNLNQENWSQASLRKIILTSLHGCGAHPDAMILQGPEVLLPPKTAVTLSMAVHELCTNAVKYGALSVPEGLVNVQWDLRDKSRLNFVWRESGGPPVAQPTRRGFGTRMIEHALAADLEGAVHFAFDPEGLRCEVEASVGSPGILPASEGSDAPHGRGTSEMAT